MISVALLAAAATIGNLSGLPVIVQGTSRCPTPAEVAAALPGLLPITNDLRPDVAWIETAGPDLAITLQNSEGDSLLSRRLSSRGTCADLANAAAVVIAAWKSERNPELSLLQPAARPPRTVKSKAPAPASPVPSPVAPARPPSVSVEVGAGIGASVDSAGWAGSGHVDLALRRRQLGLHLSFAADTERDQIIAGRIAGWRRVAAGVGPSVAIVNRAVVLELRAQFLAGLIMVRGQTLDSNQQRSSFSPGLAAGLRLGANRGRLRPWLDVGGRLWLVREYVAATRESDSAARALLPRIDLRLLLGASFVLHEGPKGEGGL